MKFRIIIFANNLITSKGYDKEIKVTFPTIRGYLEQARYFSLNQVELTQLNGFTKIQIPLELYKKKRIPNCYSSGIWSKDDHGNTVYLPDYKGGGPE